MKRISGGKKYLAGGIAPSEAIQQVPPQEPQQANSNLFSFWYRSTHGQANDPARSKAKTKATNRTR